MDRNIWVCGEVLIDLIPIERKPNVPKKAIVGGGPANTATALAKLGCTTFFIDGISTSDDFGKSCQEYLIKNGVDLSLAYFVSKPTSTADVTLDENGGASYIFTFDGTATFDYLESWLPTTNLPDLLHIGTLATIIEPGASILLKWARELSKNIPIVLDPNIRPTVISDNVKYQSYIEPWIEIAQFIKVSEDDINWLYPNKSEKEIIFNWINLGAKLVVVTRGSSGISGYYSINQEIKKVHVSGVKIQVVDTVGAGDTVGAILAKEIVTNPNFYLDSKKLENNLRQAAIAAAMTCSRAGANTPTSEELNAATLEFEKKGNVF